MTDELTVLLVGGASPPEGLSEQLEDQQIFAEQCSPGELKNMLELAEPALVVQFGHEGAEETVEALKKAPGGRKVRLVIVAARDKLAQLRKLDRSVVASLLATDVTAPVVATRVSMLARKPPERHAPLPRQAGPRPPRSPSETSSTEGSVLTRLPATTEGSVLSHLPPSPKPSVEPPPPLADRSALPPEPFLKLTGDPQRAPRPPSPTSKSSARGAAPAAPPPPTPPPLPAEAIEASLPPKASPAELPGTPSTVEISEAPPETEHDIDLTKAPRKPAGERPPPASFAESPRFDAPSPRIAVADTDMTRGDLIACALRSAGIETRLVPLDPSATHWPLVRSFRPTLLLADSKAIQSEGKVWHQLFRADESLHQVKVVAVAFSTLFDESDGSVNLRVLGPQIPPLLRAETFRPVDEDDAFDTRPTTMVDEYDIPTTAHNIELPPLHSSAFDADFAPKGETSDEEDERETVLVNELTSEGERDTVLADDEEDRATLLKDVQELESLVQDEAKSPPPKKAPDPQETSTRDETSASSSPISSSPGEDTAAHAPVVQSTPAPKKSGASRYLAVAGLLAALGGGSWYALSPGQQPSPAVSKTSAAPPEPAQMARPEEGSAAANEAPLPPQTEAEPVDPFRVRPQEPVPDCVELVDNLETLQAGGIGQANLSWDKARQSLVQGDLDKALRLMCEAALLHPRSMAVEGLAGLYLTKHSPDQAMVWVKKGLEVRPDRRKTKELEGDVYAQLGESEKARELWAEALNVDPKNQKLLSVVADQFGDNAEQRLRAGDVAGAELFFRRAATLNSKSPRAAAGVAQVLLERGDREGARLWAERSLSLQENYSAALVVLADMALLDEKKEEALEMYKKAVESDPRNGRAHTQIYRLEH